jgi:uncharacterized protein (TIGR02996 family)
MDEQQALLDALAANPEDEAAWLVYADWLEEQGHPGSDFLRLTVALGQGPETEQATALVRGLKRLRKSIDPTWLERVIALRAGLPLRIRVTDVIRLGHIPPREMFDRAMSLVCGILESGTVRIPDDVCIPLEDGGGTVERVISLASFTKDYREISAGQQPSFGFAMAWSGHRLVDRGVRKGGVITRAS